MKIIIFGGSGFLGKKLVNELAKRQYSVVACDIVKEKFQKDVKFMNIDVRDRAALESVPIEKDDIVINLTCNQYSNKLPKKNRTEFFMQTNANGAKNILDAAFNKGCTNFIQYSTDMTYGFPQYLPIDTKHPQKPLGPYGSSKKVAEGYCYEYRKKGMNITIFRPRMIIGPGRLGILEKLFLLIRYNLPVPLIGNGKNCYQMISVFDCVAATILAIEKGIPNKEYNLGSKNPPQTRILLKSLAEDVHSKSIIMPTPGRLVKFVLSIFENMGFSIMYKEQYMIADINFLVDISETEKDLDWSPKYNDRDMILQSYKSWYKSQKKSRQGSKS